MFPLAWYNNRLASSKYRRWLEERRFNGRQTFLLSSDVLEGGSWSAFLLRLHANIPGTVTLSYIVCPIWACKGTIDGFSLFESFIAWDQGWKVMLSCNDCPINWLDLLRVKESCKVSIDSWDGRWLKVKSILVWFIQRPQPPIELWVELELIHEGAWIRSCSSLLF